MMGVMKGLSRVQTHAGCVGSLRPRCNAVEDCVCQGTLPCLRTESDRAEDLLWADGHYRALRRMVPSHQALLETEMGDRQAPTTPRGAQEEKDFGGRNPRRNRPSSRSQSRASPSCALFVSGPGDQVRIWWETAVYAAQFVGITCLPGSSIVDTAAEDGCVGASQLVKIAQSLYPFGLKFVWVASAGDSGPTCTGIGGGATWLGAIEVPVGIAGVNGVIKLNVIQDSVAHLSHSYYR